MANLQRDRALARERIATLIYAMDKRSPLKEEKKQLKTLLKRDRIEKTTVELLTLQSRGFLYTAEEFIEERAVFAKGRFFKSDPDAFIRYSLLKALDQYIKEFDDKNYVNFYQEYKKTIENKDKAALKKLEPLLIRHQELAASRALSTRIAFFHQMGLPLPEAIRQKALEKYPNWNGQYPLHEVSQDDEKQQAAIRLDDLGISREELYTIMNQGSELIDMPGLNCDGKPNPFRQFTFEDPRGVSYQVGASFDLDQVLKVHAYETDAQGKRKFVVQSDFSDWMNAPVKGVEAKNVTQAVTEALLLLRDYIGAPNFKEEFKLRKESLNDMVDTLYRYHLYETAIQTMEPDELEKFWQVNQKQHRLDKRRIEGNLNSFLQFLLDEEDFDYDAILHHLTKDQRVKLKEALTTVLLKFSTRELMLVGERIEHVEGLLSALS